MVSLVHERIPQVNELALSLTLNDLLDNAVQHGGIEGNSNVQFTVSEKEGALVVSILNDRVFPLPPTLTGKQITPHTPSFRVPVKERDKTGGKAGRGVENTVEGVKLIYYDAVATPVAEWTEVDSIPGKPKILLQLTLPIPPKESKK